MRTLRRKMAHPKKSEDLAEFFGIMLGGGGITRKQISITLDRELVDFLMKLGLKKGNKVKQGADIPEDGSVFTHWYKVNRRLYAYKKMCFDSHSRPLLESVDKFLSGLGFTPKIRKEDLCLYNEKEVKRYFKEIGTHNPKHLRKFLN